MASFTISSRPFLGEVYRYRRENGIACVACRAAKRPGRPAMKRDFVAPTHSASPLDEILTKNTYRVSYRVLVRIMIRGETYSKNKLYKYPVSQILRSEFRAWNKISWDSNSPISAIAIKYLKWKVSGVCISCKKENKNRAQLR